MPYLNNIVCKINNSLLATPLRDGILEGIAFQVTRKVDSGEQLFPATGDGKDVSIDDSKKTVVYHRHIRNSYRKDLQMETHYTQTVQMLMVVYANKNLIENADSLESLIIQAFPVRYEQPNIPDLTGVFNINVSVISSEMNPVTVFAGEYRNVPYRLSTDDIYFSLSYTLEIKFDNTCLDVCDFVAPADTLCEFIEQATGQQVYECLSEEQISYLEEQICEDSEVELVNTDSDIILTQTIHCGIPGQQIVVPDTTYNIYISGNLTQSFTVATLANEVINIYP